jgi:hypothetical protein
MPREQKITLGEMRESGPRRLLVYCADYRCAHLVVTDADYWPDNAVATLMRNIHERQPLSIRFGALSEERIHGVSIKSEQSPSCEPE